MVLGSIGVAVAEGAGTDPVDLLRVADAAMYTAKRSGSGLVFAEERVELPPSTPTL
jgi:GGDEF domain-containing protein